MQVIHMNGRIYDPQLGRFLQPDPVIQEPTNAQSWNAYTYVFNVSVRPRHLPCRSDQAHSHAP